MFTPLYCTNTSGWNTSSLNIILILQYQPVYALASALLMTIDTNKTGLAVLMVRSGTGHHI
jgi:hypothetical protein